MRPIDTDELMAKIDAWDESAMNGTNPNCKNGNEYEAAMDICIMVEEAPTIDAVPVVHSWWEITEHNNSLIPCIGYRCHNCGSKYARINTQKKEYNYCPDCGARMDGEEEHNAAD